MRKRMRDRQIDRESPALFSRELPSNVPFRARAATPNRINVDRNCSLSPLRYNTKPARAAPRIRTSFCANNFHRTQKREGFSRRAPKLRRTIIFARREEYPRNGGGEGERRGGGERRGLMHFNRCWGGARPTLFFRFIFLFRARPARANAARVVALDSDREHSRR